MEIVRSYSFLWELLWTRIIVKYTTIFGDQRVFRGFGVVINLVALEKFPGHRSCLSPATCMGWKLELPLARNAVLWCGYSVRPQNAE